MYSRRNRGTCTPPATSNPSEPSAISTGGPGEAVNEIGQYKAQGISFANQATQFQLPAPLPDAATHTGQWQVNPNR
jgi:hypothetical protein